MYEILLVLALIAATSLAVFYFSRANYWKEKYLDTGFTIELELATLDQIIDELRSRPTTSFIMVESKEVKDGLTVTAHACNIDPPAILASLRAAYDGMAHHFGVEGEKDASGEE